MLRDFLWTNGSQTFAEGNINNKAFLMSTNTNLTRRLSWYNDGKNNDGFNYLYYTGLDGLLHEITYHIPANTWQQSYSFNNSNGYSGSTILADSSHNLSTMHLINQDGQLQLWWRNLSDGSTPAAPWTEGVDSAGANWPVEIYRNSTLAMSQNTGVEAIVQDLTGELYGVGWQGYRATQQWDSPVDSGIKAMLGTGVAATGSGNLFPGLNVKASVFVQLNGSDITHLLRNNSALSIYHTLPV